MHERRRTGSSNSIRCNDFSSSRGAAIAAPRRLYERSRRGNNNEHGVLCQLHYIHGGLLARSAKQQSRQLNTSD